MQPGLTTWAEHRKGVYLQDNLSKETVQVGLFDESLPGTENRMVAMESGFLSLGVPALQRCMVTECDWITIDEIGYLEAQCEVYQDALRQLLETKQVNAVVRKQAMPFLQELCSREDAFVVDLDHPYGSIGCVIMASGLGKRFGGNKLMADFRGEPMICKILDVTEELTPHRVVVTRHKDVAKLCEARGIQAVLHDLPHRSDTVRLGLEAVGDVERCMFATADQPLLRKETISALALAAQNEPREIWRAAYGEMLGSPVVFPKWTFSELMNLPQGKGGGVIIKTYPERLRLVNVRDMFELKDIDSPEDLSELLER